MNPRQQMVLFATTLHTVMACIALQFMEDVSLAGGFRILAMIVATPALLWLTTRLIHDERLVGCLCVFVCGFSLAVVASNAGLLSSTYELQQFAISIPVGPEVSLRATASHGRQEIPGRLEEEPRGHGDNFRHLRINFAIPEDLRNSVWHVAIGAGDPKEVGSFLAAQWTPSEFSKPILVDQAQRDLQTSDTAAPMRLQLNGKKVLWQPLQLAGLLNNSLTLKGVVKFRTAQSALEVSLEGIWSFVLDAKDSSCTIKNRREQAAAAACTLIPNQEHEFVLRLDRTDQHTRIALFVDGKEICIARVPPVERKSMCQVWVAAYHDGLSLSQLEISSS